MKWKRRHKGPHVIPSMGGFSPMSKGHLSSWEWRGFSPIRGGHLATSNLRKFAPIRESHLSFYEWKVFRVKACILAVHITINTSANLLVN